MCLKEGAFVEAKFKVMSCHVSTNLQASLFLLSRLDFMDLGQINKHVHKKAKHIGGNLEVLLA